MKRTLAIIGVLAIALLVGSTYTQASARSNIQTMQNPYSLGDTTTLRDRSAYFPTELELSPVNLPSPGDPVEGTASARPGPIAISDGGRRATLHPDSMGAPGAGLVGPRGGSVYSPKQSADREIKSVIRRLNK